MEIKNIGSNFFYRDDHHGIIKGSRFFNGAKPICSLPKDYFANVWQHILGQNQVQKEFGDVNLLVRRASKDELKEIQEAEVIATKALNP